MLKYWSLFVRAGILLLALGVGVKAGGSGYDSLKVTIKFDEGVSPTQIASLLSNIGRIDRLLDDPETYHGFVACSLTSGDGYLTFIDSLRSIDAIQLVEPYYVTEEGVPWLVGESFCVGLETGVSGSQLEVVNSSLGVVIESQIMENVLLIRNTKSSGRGLWELVNAYDTLPQVRFAQPNRRSRFGPVRMASTIITMSFSGTRKK